MCIDHLAQNSSSSTWWVLNMYLLIGWQVTVGIKKGLHAFFCTSGRQERGKFEHSGKEDAA